MTIDFWHHLRQALSPDNARPFDGNDNFKKHLVITTGVVGPKPEFAFEAKVPRSDVNDLPWSAFWAPGDGALTRGNAAAFLREVARLIEETAPSPSEAFTDGGVVHLSGYFANVWCSDEKALCATGNPDDVTCTECLKAVFKFGVTCDVRLNRLLQRDRPEAAESEPAEPPSEEARDYCGDCGAEVIGAHGHCPGVPGGFSDDEKDDAP